MPAETATSRPQGHIRQFSIYADNKVGRLNDLVNLLEKHDLHILALCSIDTTDSAIIRMVATYWEQVREVLTRHGFTFSINEVLAVELPNLADLNRVTCALISAEINIHYLYPMLLRPNHHCGLILRLEDSDLGTDVLNQSGLRVLLAEDLSR